MTISHKDRLAIAALLNGATDEQAGEAAGYSPRTVRRRRDGDPEFQAALAQAYDEALERVRHSVTSAAMVGVQTLVVAASNRTGDVPWSSRVSAAKTLVELTVSRWITVTGPAGGPIEVTATTPQAELIARLERLTAQPQAIEVTSTNA